MEPVTKREASIDCPFCAAGVDAAQASYALAVGEARDAAEKLTSLLTAR